MELINIEQFIKQVKWCEGIDIRVNVDQEALVKPYPIFRGVDSIFVHQWIDNHLAPCLRTTNISVIDGTGKEVEPYSRLRNVKKTYKQEDNVIHDTVLTEDERRANIKAFTEPGVIKDELEYIRSTILRQLIDQRNSLGLSYRQVSSLTGINYTVLNSFFFNNDRPYSVADLVRRAAAYGLKVKIDLVEPTKKDKK